MTSVEELAGLLGEERQRLEFLLFKLVAAGQLLRAGETRFLGWSSAEIEDAASQVHEMEAVRTAVVGRAAEELRVRSSHPSLRVLAARADEPYRAILDDHRLALRELLHEIDRAQDANVELATERLKLVHDVVELIDASAPESGGEE
jgi:hypothetical protein